MATQNRATDFPGDSNFTNALPPTPAALQEKIATLEMVTRTLNTFLESGNCIEASKHLLSFALRQTQSTAGFLGVVLEGPVLRVLVHEGALLFNHRDESHDSDSSNDHHAQVQQFARQPFFEVPLGSNLLVEVIAQRRALISNDIETHRLPSGHPQILHLLGVPICKGSETVAVLAVANRQGGYTTDQLRSLETACQATGLLYDNYRQSVQRAQLEEQRARLEAEFRQSQKMEVLGQLAGGIAHDFNNSLMVLSGSANLLERTLPANSSAGPYLDQIRRTTEKAAMVTRQSLAFSRKQVLDVKPIDVHEALSDCEFMLPRLLGSDVELTFQPEARSSWICADAAQFEQVVVNLAVNARDAMPVGGPLSIRTWNEDRLPGPVEWSFGASESAMWIVLEVKDAGSGMDEQTRAHIFEPFFTTKPVGKGTGLGLSTVYGIVTQFGGKIEVHSELNVGTRFLISFPVANSLMTRNAAALRAPESAFTAVPRERLTILLVDDEPALCQAIAECLREAGHCVLDSQNPYDALELARYPGRTIDLLLTDIVMPGLRGTELAQQVRALQPGIQLIYMSGYAEGLADLAIPAGAVFLQKPFRFASLLEQITLVKRSGTKT
jgi:signal transduction histidine kinase/ActR/RegA family two-component response regulator